MSVTVASVTARTNAKAVPVVQSTSFTAVALKWTNTSTTDIASFSLFATVSGSSAIVAQSSSDVTVAAGGTGTYTFIQLNPGTSYIFGLRRFEYQSYVGQGTVSATTSNASLQMSVGPDSAVAQWPSTDATSVFKVQYGLKGGAVQGSKAASAIDASGNRSAGLTSLSPGTYTAALIVTEGGKDVTLDSADFTIVATTVSTPATALAITNVVCSKCDVQWSGSASTVYRLVDKTARLIMVGDTTGSLAATTLTDLLPGTQYTFNLQQRNQDGTYTDGMTASFTTMSSVLTVAATTSSTAQLTWTAAYPSAQYTVSYAAGTATAITKQTGSALSLTLTGLVANTTYTIKLAVLESGSTATVARAALSTPALGVMVRSSSGSSSSIITDRNIGLLVMLCLGVIFVVVGVTRK